MKRGFTLVELSIVLVIIGLLIGGILAGQSMIRTARILQTIRQMQQYNVIAQNFQVQYNCLPGDCSTDMGFVNQFSAYFGFNFPPYNTGNQDGLIDSTGVTNADQRGVYNYETYNFWAVLEQAKLIPAITTRVTGNYNQFYNAGGINSPTAPVIKRANDGATILGGGWWIFSLTAATTSHYAPPNMTGNVFSLGFGNSAGGVFPAVLRNADSAAIDAKIDDGLPLSGTVQATAGSFSNNYYDLVPPDDGYYSPNCLNGAKYKLSGLTGFQECGLVIKADF